MRSWPSQTRVRHDDTPDAYRDVSVDDTLIELERYKGTQFDFAVGDAFRTFLGGIA